jgi:hypothetical protein
MKICTKCKKELSNNAFYQSERSRNTWCKKCLSSYNKRKLYLKKCGVPTKNEVKNSRYYYNKITHLLEQIKLRLELNQGSVPSFELVYDEAMKCDISTQYVFGKFSRDTIEFWYSRG